MAEKRQKDGGKMTLSERIASLSPAFQKIAARIELCSKARPLPEDLSTNCRTLLHACPPDRLTFDIDCKNCVHSRIHVLREASADDLKEIYSSIFKSEPRGPWTDIAQSVISSIAYEVVYLAESRYHEFHLHVLRSRQSEARKGSVLSDEEIAQIEKRKENEMASKREKPVEEKAAAKEKPVKEKPVAAKKPSNDKIAALLDGKTPKQMLALLKEHGVAKDKIDGVKSAIDGGTGFGLVRMRVGNLLRGVLGKK